MTSEVIDVDCPKTNDLQKKLHNNVALALRSLAWPAQLLAIRVKKKKNVS